MKFCVKCKEEKLEKEFSKKMPWCKSCVKLYDRQRYQKSPETHKQRAIDKSKKYKQENRKRIIEYLKERQCLDCGEDDILVLQFDHRSNKKYTVSEMLSHHPWESISEEIEKCDVRCANCHIKKTAKDFAWYKTKFENVV